MAYGFAAAVENTPTTHQVQVGSRFNGPPGSGNGGYTVGMLGKHLGDEVEITLKRPIPMDAAMQVATDGATAALFHEGVEIASARVAELDVDIPEAVSFKRAAAARADYAGYKAHPFPNCFVCGTHRSCGEGMCLFTGEATEGIVASSWVPNEEFADDRGNVTPEFVCAALDCPGAWALIERYGIDGPVVLGRLTYRIDRPIQAGGRYVVMGWALGREGRKAFCGTAVYDSEGNLCAAAKATWIQLR